MKWVADKCIWCFLCLRFPSVLCILFCLFGCGIIQADKLKSCFKASQLLTHQLIKYFAVHLNSKVLVIFSKTTNPRKPSQTGFNLTALYIFMYTQPLCVSACGDQIQFFSSVYSEISHGPKKLNDLNILNVTFFQWFIKKWLVYWWGVCQKSIFGPF